MRRVAAWQQGHEFISWLNVCGEVGGVGLGFSLAVVRLMVLFKALSEAVSVSLLSHSYACRLSREPVNLSTPTLNFGGRRVEERKSGSGTGESLQLCVFVSQRRLATSCLNVRIVSELVVIDYLAVCRSLSSCGRICCCQMIVLNWLTADGVFNHSWNPYTAGSCKSSNIISCYMACPPFFICCQRVPTWLGRAASCLFPPYFVTANKLV